MANFLRSIIEIVFWMGLFLSSLLFFLFIASVIVLLNNDLNVLWFYILGGIGAIIGVILAEYIRKKYGCSNFYGSLLSMSEFRNEKEGITSKKRE